MDAWIDLARGPFFRLSLLICVLGLAFRVGNAALQIALAWRRAGDRDLPIGSVIRAASQWLFPHRLIATRPLYSLASFLFHVGIVLLPIFLAGHIALLRGIAPPWWPTLPPTLADILTVVAVLAVGALLLGRAASRAARALTTAQDVAVLGLLLVVLVCGFLAANPQFSPLDARTVLFLHIASGDLALLLTPFTKLVHCALVPLSHLLGEVGWHFPAESGRHVAIALDKENEPV